MIITTHCYQYTLINKIHIIFFYPLYRSTRLGGGSSSMMVGFPSKCRRSVVARSDKNVWSKKLASAAGPSDRAANTQCRRYTRHGRMETPPPSSPPSFPVANPSSSVDDD